jgi:hypothetical protein
VDEVLAYNVIFVQGSNEFMVSWRVTVVFSFFTTLTIELKGKKVFLSASYTYMD